MKLNDANSEVIAADAEGSAGIRSVRFNEIVRRELRSVNVVACGCFFWGVRMVLLLLPALAAIYAYVSVLSREDLFDSTDAIPVRYVGLVLGCPEKSGSHDNSFFVARVKAAKTLIDAGKVQYLLVSGADRDGCNEPLAMKVALVAAGVSPRKIYCDFGGGKTLDSVVRARNVFGQRDITIVSQNLHNERALYMARRRGMPDSVAFNANGIEEPWTFSIHVKEIVARVLSVLDVEFSDSGTKFSGERINIGPHWPPQDNFQSQREVR